MVSIAQNREDTNPRTIGSLMQESPVAVVTGGSRGIGRGIALALASCGHDIVLNYARNEEAARATAAQITERGRVCRMVRGDVSRIEDHPGILEAASRGFGRVDLLVNNAGIAPRVRLDLLETSPESYDEVMSTNLRGPMFLTQAFARRMLELKKGGTVPHPRIVFISSISAYVASPSRGEYCISKAGLAMLAQLFAARLAGEGIPVFEVRPGIIATDMTAKVKGKYDTLIAEGLVPQGRWGTPEDVGRAVAAIARGDLDFSTGQVIEVGGGFSMRVL